MLKRLFTIPLIISALLTASIFILMQTHPLPTMPIAYEASLHGNWEIYVMDAARGLSYNITQHRAWDSTPTWSPDGQQVVFLSDRDGPIGLYVMDAMGGPARRLIDGSTTNFSAVRWTDDSQYITYISRNNNSFTRNQIDVRTGDITVLITDADRSQILLTQAEGGQPNFPLSSRQGDLTAFMRYRDGAWGLYLSRHGLSDAQLLIRGHTYSNSPPSLSPDAKRILFISAPDGQRNVYMLDLSCLDAGNCQQAARRLTNSPIWKGRPIWLPA